MGETSTLPSCPPICNRNKIISQEIIHSIKLQLTKGNIQGVNSAINDALQEIDNTPFNVAVIGLSGAGKSCFINALRRVEPEEKDAAPFGVLEITKHRMPCKHPKNSKVILWELPAMETTNLHANDYLEKVKFNDYDFFIIISGTRFTQHDLDLAKEIRKMKKDFYYVKTKVDSDLKNEEKIHPTAFEKEKFLQQIRYHFAQSFKQNNIDEPQIFLISNNNLSEYDLQILNNVLSKELPAQKHNNFMLSLLNIAEAAIERKRESLKHLIRLEALKVTLLPYTPNVLEKSDVEKLKESLYEYQDIFGVDDASLQNLAKDWQIPMEQLKEIIKSPSLLKTKKEETIQEKLWEYWQMVCSDNGNLLTMNFYIRIIFCLQIYFLDTVTNDAKQSLSTFPSFFQFLYLLTVMGQLFSGTSNDEQQKDLASSFTAYFKNVKVENQIISQETIHSIESHLMRGNIQGANSAISDALKEIDNTPVNVAVTGESGTGKSSFINALRGVGHEEKDAAPTGAVETTMHRMPYKHRNIPNVIIWDLPGIGTTNFQPKDYLEKVKFSEYDFFIIISSTRFTKNDVDLAKAVRYMKKNFYFVRSKVDFDLWNEKHCKPSTYDREKVLQLIRNYCVDTFKKNNIDEPQIFLISSRDLSEYDFPVLMDTLIKCLPAQKRHSFLLSLPNITEAAIERKREFLKQFIWLETLMVGISTYFPIVNDIIDNDVKLLKASLYQYQVHFGVDDASLQSLAKDWQVPVEQLKEIIKSPNLLKTTNEETIQEKILECWNMLCLAKGSPLNKSLYAKKVFYLQLYFLDIVTADAKILLKEIYYRNRLSPFPMKIMCFNPSPKPFSQSRKIVNL
uniref:IRG-type G domain-containing protein n=1 Tax=Castor canadensis TaxID=51338 RepID=A0A8C0ZZ01_CASCN